MSNLEKVKNSVDFLKVESNKNEYSLIRCGKNVYNYKKHQLNEVSHSPTVDYFLIPKNSYNSLPFGNSQFYIDFDLPKIQYSIYEFVLRFTMNLTQAASGAQCPIIPYPLIIDRISVLKNSNALGNDTYDWDILLYNLNKYYNDLLNYDITNQLGVGTNSLEVNGKLFFGSVITNGSAGYNISLPISLNYSSFPLDLIQNDITLRIYFKSNVLENTDLFKDNMVQLSNVGLVLRVNELSNDARKHICCQPKLNHLFNKRIFTKINVNSLTAGQNYQIVIPGFRQVASSVLIFFSSSDNAITNAQNNGYYWHTWRFGINNVYITDSAGRNILNNNKYDQNYNRYLISNHFNNLNNVFNSNTNSQKNSLGELTYIPFCNEESDSFNGAFSGGMPFKDTGDYSINFTSNHTCSNVILTLMWFVPSILSLHNGDLTETYA